MPLWLLANWKLIAAGAVYVASLALVGIGVHNYVSRGYEAAISAQKAEAATTLATLTDRARKKENEDAENARNVEAVYQSMLADAFGGRDDFAKRLRIARRGASCGGASSPAPADPRKPADVASGGGVGLGLAASVDPLLQARDGVKALQAFTVACHKRIMDIGR